MTIAADNDKAVQEVRRAAQDWIDIYIRNEAEAFSDLLTRDFLYISPVCEVVNRASYLDNLHNKTVVMQYARSSDMTVRFYDDVAIVTAQWDVSETYRGQLFAGPCRFTRVWVRQADRWRAATFQVTECPQSSS